MDFSFISNGLVGQGFVRVSKDSDVADILMRVTQDNVMEICCVVKNLYNIDVPEKQYCDTAMQFERKFLLNGYKDVRVMHIIITDKDINYNLMSDNNIKFWIVDVRQQKLMIFENQPNDYEGMRELIESRLYDRTFYEVQKSEAINHSFPFVVFSIAVINIIIFTLCNNMGDLDNIGFLVDIGASNHNLVFGGNEFYRLISSMFLHGGFSHLYMNMVMLIIAGSQAEQRLGHLSVGVLYFLSGFASSVASVIVHMLLDDSVVSLGASGAIYGIMGALLVLSIKEARSTGFAISQLVIFTIILLSGIQPEVDYIAHIGGLLMGVIATLCITFSDEKQS